MLFDKKIILVVAAHPDDEVLGCGGSIAKWSKNRNDIHVLIMAEGATSRDEKRNRNAKKKELTNLSKSARKAGEILGVKSVNLLDYPDNRMDSINFLDVVKTIEKYIRKFKPNVVVTHFANDLNIDHNIIHQAVVTACRPKPGFHVKRILSFEVPSATEWQSPLSQPNFVPNWFEDISDTLELKDKALDAYKNEMREWPHTRSIKAIKHLTRWRGASVGVKAAEAFMLVREIR